MKYIFTLSIFICSSVLYANQTYSKEEIMQRIDRYKTLPDHKAIVSAIDSKKQRAIGFSIEKRSIKVAKDSALQECLIEKRKRHIKASCKILALDNAIGCKEVKQLLKHRFVSARKKSQRIEQIHKCLSQESLTLVKQCTQENHLGHKLSNKLTMLWKNKDKKEKTLKKFDKLIHTNKVADKQIQQNIDTVECLDYRIIKMSFRN